MPKVEITTEVAGSVWKIEASVGDLLAAEEVILILESMKMEIPIETPCAGKIIEILVNEADSVDEDQVIAIIEIP